MLPDKLEGKEFQEYLIEIVKDNSKYKHVNYEKSTEHYKEMGVHAWGNKPVKVLEQARPREDPQVREYRLNSWEAITLSVFDKAITVLQKMFNENLYSVIYPPQPSGATIKEEDNIQNYLTKFYPLYDSVFAYSREVLLKQMIADANGVVLIAPSDFFVQQADYLRPVPIVFNSYQVLDYQEGQYFLVKDQKVIKTKYGEGAIIFLITKFSIVVYSQLKKEQGTNDFEETGRFDHNFGILPAWFLGGITNSEVWPYYFTSFFNAALPHWNKAIRHESDLDGAYVNHLHPQKWEFTIDCDYEDHRGHCQSGYQIWGDQKKTICPGCKGTGRKTVKSPFEVYSVTQEKFTEKQEIVPPAGYINVPVEIVEKLELRVEKCINKGLSSINMEIVNQLGENQSGIAKEYDRTELHSFIQQVADYMFDNHIHNIIYFTNRYRYEEVIGPKVDEYAPIVVKPTAFDTLSVKELTQEIAAAKTANVNPDYITAIEKDAAAKRFATNPEEKEKILAILDLNPFNNKSTDDKMNMLLNGSVLKIDVVLSDNITQFVERAILENTGFLELDRIKQKEILMTYAKEVTGSEVTVNLEDPTGLATDPNMQTPVDVEAEAKAKLKGSVGGVQGILAIQTQVSEGITPYSAALAILDLIYGIGETEGRRILGDENEIKKTVEKKQADQLKIAQINVAGSPSK